MRDSRAKIIWSVVAWTVVLVVVFPLIWMILTSVKPQAELFRIPPTLGPETITFEHYRRLLTETPFLQYFRNSMILAVTTTVVVVVFGTLGAYSLVRFRYRGGGGRARVRGLGGSVVVPRCGPAPAPRGGPRCRHEL